MNPKYTNSYTTSSSNTNSRCNLAGIQSLSKLMNQDTFSKEIRIVINSAKSNELIYESESDVSHESVAEKKILKIDHKLRKYK